MCDYCGCRREGPTAELAAEHEELLRRRDALWTARAQGEPVAPEEFVRFVDLLERHAAKEELGLFEAGRAATPMGPAIDTLCAEHDELRLGLAHGLDGPGTEAAFVLLGRHIDDEEYDLFPHLFHALDPEHWDQIELAHRAVDEAWRDAG